MFASLARLAGQYLAVLFAVSAVACALITAMPGDPVDMMLAGNPHATAQDAARLKEIYGVGTPFHERYAHWLADLARGDAGYSRLYNQPVIAVAAQAAGKTALLSGLGFILAVLLALPLGIASARRPGGFADRVVTGLSLAALSCPPFWIGIALIVLFAVTLGWLPAGGVEDGGKSLILPVATLSLAGFGLYARHARAAMIRAYAMLHIRTARAKGAGEARVTFIHALPHALAPLIILAGLDLGALLSGTLAIEIVFGIPGMGRMMSEAILGNDYNLALFGLLGITVMVLVGNALADIACRLIDPRLARTAT